MRKFIVGLLLSAMLAGGGYVAYNIVTKPKVPTGSAYTVSADWKEKFNYEQASTVAFIKDDQLGSGDYVLTGYNQPIHIGETADDKVQMYVNPTTNGVIISSEGIILAPEDCTEFFALNLNGEQHFLEKSNIIKIVLDNFDTRNVVNMKRMFFALYNLEEDLDISNFNTSKVTDMSEMFSYYWVRDNENSTLDFSSFNTSKVTNMEHMFFYAQMKTLNLSYFNTSKVANMEKMFQDAVLESLHIPNFEIKSSTNVDYMFSNSVIDNITTPKKISKKVEFPRIYVDTTNNFYNEIPLSTSTSYRLTKTVTISKFWKTETNVAQFVESNDESLTLSFIKDTQLNTGKYTLTGYNDPIDVTDYFSGDDEEVMAYVNPTESKVIISSAFAILAPEDSSDLFNFELSNDNPTFKLIIELDNFYTCQVKYMSGMFANCYLAQNLNLSKFDTRNVRDMSDMFYGVCASISSQDYEPLIDLQLNVSNFHTSNVYDMSGMFAGLGVTTLDLSNFDTSDVEDMSNMFNGSDITTLDLSNFDTTKVEDMSYMFAGTSFTTIDLSNFVTSNVEDMSNMFYASDITTVDLSNFNTSNVTDMSSMFYQSDIVQIDLSSFDTTKVGNMNYMFKNCWSLESVNLSSFVIKSTTETDSMFGSCSKLSTIYTPKTMAKANSIILPTEFEDAQHNTYDYLPVTTNNSLRLVEVA